MKKGLKILLALIAVLVLSFCLAACNGNTGEGGGEGEGTGGGTVGGGGGESLPMPELNTEDLRFNNKTVTYNGLPHSVTLSGTLPDGVSVKYAGNEKTAAGSYTVTASFYYGESHYDGKDMTATLTIKKASYDLSGVSLRDRTFVYDGSSHSLELEGLPSGLSVAYENNGMTDAGIYTVKAIISGDSLNYHPISPITARLIISKARYDMSQVVFRDEVLTYDGEAHSLKALNLPDGISVSYKNNGKTNAGTYEVKAIFSGDAKNYEAIPSMTASLVIEKAYYNTENILFESKEVLYTGQPQSILATGLPEGVTVGYTGNGVTAAGSYEITVTYQGDSENYHAIPSDTAILTIKRSDLESMGITFPDGSFTYDGQPKELEILGQLPSDISVSYSGNGKTNAGTYEVTASFTTENPSYAELPSITATLKIKKATHDMSGVSLNNLTVTYDGSAKSVSLSGRLPSGVTVSYEGNSKINAGIYTVKASFSYDRENYNEIADMTTALIINRATFDTSVLSFPDTEVTFDGNAHTPSISGEIPQGITYNIEGGGKTAAGVYTVRVHFTAEAPYNYNTPNTLTAVLTIKAPPANSEGFTFRENANGSYSVSRYNGSSTHIIIPSEYLGKAVTTVAGYAFANNKSITYAYIPASVTSINNGAFSGCENLSSITLCEGLVSIGSGAFESTGLTEIIIPDSVYAIGLGAFAGTRPEALTVPFIGGSPASSNSFLSFIFGGSSYSSPDVPSTLKELTLSEGCKSIPDYALYNCQHIERVTLGENVSYIGLNAFYGCKGIDSIYIPLSVTQIAANALATNSPFFDCSEELMIVMEQVPTAKYGQFFARINRTDDALLIYLKSYDDYMNNKNQYRDANPADPSLAAIVLENSIIDGFSGDVYDYTVDISVNSPVPEIIAAATSPLATVTITPAAEGGGITLITVTSGNGEASKQYRISYNEIDTLEAEAEIVVKDGKLGTVTYVIDDGIQETGTVAHGFTSKYGNLVFSFALKGNQLATLATAYDTATGKYYYVMEDGRYTYDINEQSVAFWENVIQGENGLTSEITSHTFTSAYWGYHDEGGSFTYINSSSGSDTSQIELPIGSVTKEIYATQQVLQDIFGGTGGLSLIQAGIASNRTNQTVDGVLYPTCLTIFNEMLKNAIMSGDLITSRATFTKTSLIESNVTYHNELANKTNRINIPAFMIYNESNSSGHKTNTNFEDHWKLYIDTALAGQGWAVFCLHNIGGNSYYRLTMEEADKLFAYTDRDDVWVATYSEASLYYCEWSTASVNATYSNGAITVTLTDKENDEIFNMPLTVKLKVPSTWRSATADGVTYEILDNGEYNYILIDIVPDSGAVTVTEGR